MTSRRSWWACRIQCGITIGSSRFWCRPLGLFRSFAFVKGYQLGGGEAFDCSGSRNHKTSGRVAFAYMHPSRESAASPTTLPSLSLPLYYSHLILLQKISINGAILLFLRTRHVDRTFQRTLLDQSSGLHTQDLWNTPIFILLISRLQSLTECSFWLPLS